MAATCPWPVKHEMRIIKENCLATKINNKKCGENNKIVIWNYPVLWRAIFQII